MTACEVRRRFRSCRQAGIAVCQYCGRIFCEQHGAQLTDGQEICDSRRCQQKRADLERHVVYKAWVTGRNSERLCGEADCGRAPAGQCSKCRGLFCYGHLRAHEIEERRGSSIVRVAASLCRHCLNRRDLWAKR